MFECEIVERGQNRSCRVVKGEVESLDVAATTTSTYIVENVRDEAPTADIARMGLKRQRCISPMVSPDDDLSSNTVDAENRWSAPCRDSRGWNLDWEEALNKVRALASFLGSPDASHELSSSLPFIKVRECITIASSRCA